MNIDPLRLFFLVTLSHGISFVKAVAPFSVESQHALLHILNSVTSELSNSKEWITFIKRLVSLDVLFTVIHSFSFNNYHIAPI